MIVETKPYQPLDLKIKKDAATGLPLLGEQEKIFELVRAYLHLPFRVTEFGCGKRTSIILKQLYDFGVSSEALTRGMVMEKDMSDAALKQEDSTQRPHALRLTNALYDLIDLNDDRLLAKLQQEYDRQGITFKVDKEKQQIQVGPYTLNHTPETQFKYARSHIFPIVRFWDSEQQCIVERVIDPTVDRYGPFAVRDMRERLHPKEAAHPPEALLFSSAIGGRFKLRLDDLSDTQRTQMDEWLAGRTFEELSRDEEHRLYLHLNGAEKDTIGDPETWTYANNYNGIDGYYNIPPTKQDLKHIDTQHAVTDAQAGDVVATKTEELLEQQEATDISAADPRKIRDAIKVLQTTDLQPKKPEELTIPDLIRQDAAWSEDKLRVLIPLVNIAVYYKAQEKTKAALLNEEDPAKWLQEMHEDSHDDMAIRLRDRIECLADVSRNTEGEIDARTLTPEFNRATVELIRQMNEAGMLVYIDRVGNVHGLLADDATRQELEKGGFSPDAIRNVASRALGFHSHIDTVFNAGKYDGRLGVLSGVEIAHTLTNMKNGGDTLGIDAKLKKQPIMVSAYINEEMSYGGIAMPGSAAVSGLAVPEEIYKAVNDSGEQFGKKLVEMMQALKQAITENIIHINHPIADSEHVLQQLPDPTLFLPRQAIERHCEQASALMNAGVPLAQAEAIMGIYQEDYTIQGDRAEEAALQLNLCLRELQEKTDAPEAFVSSRITMGIWDNGKEEPPPTKLCANRYILSGERNHAGATTLANRFDPGVATARLAAAFRKAVADLSSRNGVKIRPVICEASYTPGISRNVIPDTAGITLGIAGEGASEAVLQSLHEQMEETLNAMLCDGQNDATKDIEHWTHRKAENPVSPCKHIRTSVDVRTARSEHADAFIETRQRILKELEQEFGVKIAAVQKQRKEPVRLDDSRTVSLLIDQSAGGSHNPNEGERRSVIAAGLMAQFAAWWKLAQFPDQQIYEIMQKVIPISWQRQAGAFRSGALHDSCNVVQGIEQRRQKENGGADVRARATRLNGR